MLDHQVHEHTVETKSAASLFSGSKRFSVVKGNRGSNRGEQLDRFLERLNAARVGTKYKPLTIQRLAMMLAHIPTEDLHAFYQMCEKSDLPFGAKFHYELKPRDKRETTPTID